MIHQLWAEQGVLILRSYGRPLRADDFTAITRDVAPYLDRYRELKGLMIEASEFPGWENLKALRGHLRFMRDHRLCIRRVAVVSSSKLLKLVPKVARRLIDAPIRVFPTGRRIDALAWIETGESPTSGAD